MKSKLASGVLALLVAAAPCAADHIAWRPSGSNSAAKKQTTPASASIQLGAPRAWNGKPSTPPTIERTAYQPGVLPLVPIIRANGGEDELPPGFVTKKVTPSQGGGMTDPEVIPVPPKHVAPNGTKQPVYQVPPGHVTTLWGNGPVLGGNGACGPVDDCCECGTCDVCCGCPPVYGAYMGCYDRPRFWVSAEYLYWGMTDANPPPLVAINQLGAPVGTVGNPFSPFTQVPLGGDNFFSTANSGFRVSAGMWLTRRKLWGLDASYFFIRRDSQNYALNGNGGFILTRPFINAIDGAWTPQDVSNPANFTSGGVTAHNETYLWGLDFNLRRALLCGPRYHVDAFLGYRHIQLTDDFSFSERLTASPPGFQPTQFFISDQFATRNQFNGGQIGMEAEGHFLRRWFINGQFKVAFGGVNQTLNVNGLFVTGPVGGPQATFPTGVAAAPSNIGRHSRTRFAVASEMNIKVGYELTDNWRIFVGYNLMYLSSVIRAAEQIDPVLVPGTLPSFPNTPAIPAQRPAVLFRTSGFVAQGVNFGLQGVW